MRKLRERHDDEETKNGRTKMNEPVIIDEEFKNLLPPLSEEEREKLKKLCLRDGIEDPLKVWNGILIDGHNRYEISEEYDLNYEIKDKTEDLLTRADVINWVIENQGARRNLTKSQLMQAYSKYEEERAKEAETRKSPGTNQYTKRSSSNLNETTESIRTAAEVAAKIGVSENTYRNMKTIVNEGTPEQIKRMDGKVKVKGKTNSVSGIKAEIANDKKIVEEHGTDEQKERMKKGGDGNKPTEIADEIKKEKNIEDPKLTKVCSECKQIYPVEYFEEGRNKCKYCRNEIKRGQLRDVKGNIIPYSGKYDDVSDSEIIGDLYDCTPKTITIDDVIAEFNANLESCIVNLRRVLDTNKAVVCSNKEKISEMLNDASKEFQTIRKDYI